MNSKPSQKCCRHKMLVWGGVSDPAAASTAALSSAAPQLSSSKLRAATGPTGRVRHNTYPRTAANATFAAATVRCTSSSVWVIPKNAATYCEGGKYTPLSSMLRKNFPNASVFDFDAESQSVTGPLL